MFEKQLLFAQSNSLPLDTAVRYGKLENGFSYYVRDNTLPRDIVSVTFVVKAGFLQEDDDQLELSHLLEHVAVKGTTNFPRGAFYYLEKMGMRVGDQLNASTGYRYTQYRFNFPADSVDALLLVLRIVRDIATNVSFKDSVLINERQAVVAEKLAAISSNMREIDKVIPQLFGASYYSKRGIGAFSFGKFNKTTNQALLRYYRDWYRSDLEAIMIVGSVDVENAVREIEKTFSSIPVKNGARRHEKHSMYVDRATKFLRFTDPQRSDFSIELYTRFEEQNFAKTSDLNRRVKLALWGELMSQRYSEIRKSAGFGNNETFYVFSKNGLASIPGINVARALSTVKHASDIRPCAVRMIQEMQRVENYGFLQSELDEAKEKCMAEISERKTAGSFIEDYIDHLTMGYSFVGPDVLRDLYSKVLADIDLLDINSFAKETLNRAAYDIVLLGPDAKRDSIPSKMQWLAIEREATKNSLPAYTPVEKPEYKVSEPRLRDAVSIRSQSVFSGITEVILNNGIRVVMKPSKGSSEDDGICIHALSKVGAGRYSQDNYYSAINSAIIVGASIFDSLKVAGVYDALEDKGVSSHAYVDDLAAGVRVYSRSRDFGILMDVMYRYFSVSRLDENCFFRWMRDSGKNLGSENSSQILVDTIRRSVYENLRHVTEADTKGINAESVYRCYRELFSDNSGAFTFIVTGNFDPANVLPILLRYVGALPGSRSLVGLNKLQVGHEEREAVHKLLYGSEKQKAVVEFRLARFFDYNANSIFCFDFLQWFLQKRLEIRLREREGGVYGVFVGGKMFRLPNDRLVLSIRFECADEQLQKLMEATRNEISTVRNRGVTSEEIADYLAFSRQKSEGLMRANIYWRFFLDDLYLLGDGLSGMSDVIEVNRKGVNIAVLNDFLSRLLDEKKLSDFLLLPPS